MEDSRLRADLAFVLKALLADTRFSWELDSEGGWHRTRRGTARSRVSAQDTLMARAAKRAKTR